ncbi:MAG: FtsH protease activity modulator HflK [Thermoanaerobaculia bacterium]
MANVVDFPSLSKLKLPKLPAAGIRAGLVVALLLIVAATSWYTIAPEEVGVVVRLGKYTEDPKDPGLHFKLPFGIDRLFKVPVQRQLEQEFGFRSPERGVGRQVQVVSVPFEADMLTGDLNAGVVEWVVQYRVVDAYKFLFRVREVEETFHDMTEAVMRSVVGDRTVNEVLTVGRQDIEVNVKEQLQELCDQYETGIRVDQVVLKDVNPPDLVKPSFNQVNQAEQEKERLVNEAQSQYNQVVPRAEGEALQTIQQAEGYALDRVNRAEGDAARFDSLYAEYRKAPEVTRKRIYLETMARILPQVGRKVIVDDSLKGVIPLLNLQEPSPAPGGRE